jgi:hypothetical protein
MNANNKTVSNVVELNGTKLTPEILKCLKSFQEDDYLSRVQQNISELLLTILLQARGIDVFPTDNKEKLDSMAGRLSMFISEIDDLKLPRELRTYDDGE